MTRLLPFAVGMLIAASAHAEKPLHEWTYYQNEAEGIVLRTTEANGRPLYASCPAVAKVETPQKCAIMIERDLLAPAGLERAVTCAPIGEMISCTIP